MRNILLTFIFCLTFSLVRANMDDRYIPALDQTVASAYSSSNTAAITGVSGVIVSSYPAFLHTVSVNTRGSTIAKLEIFNSNTSTFIAGVVIQKIASIDTSSNTSNSGLGSFTYDAYASSGITINNSGATPADVTLTFRQK